MTRPGMRPMAALCALALLGAAAAWAAESKPRATSSSAPAPHAPAAASSAPVPHEPAAAATGGPTSGEEWLPDSTTTQHWMLDNGLRVTTRSGPWAHAVAITVAYDVGSDDDPPGRDGQAQTMAELAFTAPTATLPERSRDDLDSQRPYGWSFNATRRMTFLTEVAAPSQFPGVLSQVADRMRGVKVTREALHTAVANARLVQDAQIFGPASTSLFYVTREVAMGRKEDTMQKHAAARDLDRFTVQQAQEELARRYVPANASLAIAGNLSGVDVRRLVQNLFGSIPGGARYRRAPAGPLHPGDYVVQFPRPGSSAWAMGVIAPALTDSLHPSFYLNTLVLSSYFDAIWKGEKDPAAGTHFFYALLDEPDLARIVPPPNPSSTTTEALSFAIQGSVAGLFREVVTQQDYDELRDQALWIVGGQMDSTMRAEAVKTPAAWHNLARSMAARELRGGEAFWADYRRRFIEQKAGGLQRWGDYYATPEKQVRLLVIPGK